MGFLVEPKTDLFTYVLCTAAAAFCSMIGSMWMLATYRAYHALLHSAFNDIAAAVAILQCLQSFERLVVCVVALASFNVPFLLCDISGSIDQALGVSAEVLLACFCLYLAVPQVRMRGVRWNAGYVAAALVAVVSVACCWVFLHDGAHSVLSSLPAVPPRSEGCNDALPYPAMTAGSDATQMHFTLELGWCWLPSDACWYDGFTQSELNILRAFCAYATAVGYLVAAVCALASLSCSHACCSDEDGSALGRVPTVVFLRLFLMAIFPMVALGFGAASRFSGDDHSGLDEVSALLLPLCGLWNALVFLGTEKMMLALMYRCPCGSFCESVDGRASGTYSELGSPRRTLPHGFSLPNGFTAAIRFLSCDLAIGEPRERRQVFVDVDTLLLRGSGDVRMPSMSGDDRARRGQE
jgi:hypothetical protein